MRWQLQEAKQRFSEVVREAETNGPHVVTRHGRDVVVVVAAEEYRRLRAARPGFQEFLLSGPRCDDPEIQRDRRAARPVDLIDGSATLPE